LSERLASRDPDEGGVATLEAVLVFPVLLLLLMIVFQFALWYNANELATAAAQDGARSARVVGGTAQTGIDRANSLLDESGRSLLLDRQVSAERDEVHARVEVRAVCIALVPGLHLTIDAVADSGTEQFVGRQAGG
jgi:Flp pilus assembly protein TadG